MPEQDRKRGFVLLMVLVVLAVAGSLLGVCARRTSNRILAAGIRQRQLQRKWGVRSLTAACLPRAEAILSDAEDEGKPAPAVVRRRIALGGTAFDLVIADEQAKANVNGIARARGHEGVRASAAALSEGRWVLQVISRPVKQTARGTRLSPLRYVSLEQVFAAASAADLLGPDAGRPGPAEQLTCWGDGRVHFRRAPVAVLREALKGVLSEYLLHRLCAAREEAPDARLAEVLTQLDLESEQRAQLRRHLTERSGCHSLWIVAHERSRDWYRLTVDWTGGAENESGWWIFEW